MSVVECESTIEFAGEFNFSIPDDAHIDVILLLTGNVRVANNKCQRKVTKVSENVCYYAAERGFVPVRRTMATETLAAIPTVYSVERTIYRQYWHRGPIRHSVNVIECERGRRQTYELEIEYAPDTSYEQIVALERQLVDECRVEFQLDKITLATVFEAHSPRVQMCHHFSARAPSLWAPKWNGVKGKVAFMGDHQYLWCDLQNIVKTPCKYPAVLANVCLACEIMDDGRKIAFDVCLIRYNGENYHVEPLTNVDVLRQLSAPLKTLGIDTQHFVPYEERNTLDDYVRRLAIETVTAESATTATTATTATNTFATPAATAATAATVDTAAVTEAISAMTDGYIIVQGRKIIKWKYPTVDVEYDGTNFIVGDNTLLPAPKDSMLVPGGIFEISFNRIMRRRNDRIARSNQAEYEAYKTALKFCEAIQL